MRLTVLLFLLCLLSSCNIVQDSKETIKKVLKSKNKIIYTQVNPMSTPPRLGELVLFDIESKSQVILNSNFLEYRLPRLVPGTNKLFFIRERVFNSLNFFIIDLITKNHLEVDLSKKLIPKHKTDYIDDYEFMNDSCLIFGFSDGIFKYSIYNDSLNLLTQMIGKSIDAISLNRKDNLIAFSYQDGFEEYKPKKIGFYNSLTDSIFYHDKRASFLGNWSPDRSTLVFCNTDNIILYDSHSSKFNMIEKMMGTEDIVFWECFFINSKELLAHGSKYWGIEESNFYIYNIETNSITSQLTHDDLAKVELSFSN